MSLLKILLFSSAVLLSACNSGSSSGQRDPLIKKTDSKRTCVPESELLAGGIIGGQIVEQNDGDSKMIGSLQERRGPAAHSLRWLTDRFDHPEVDGQLDHAKVMIRSSGLDSQSHQILETQVASLIGANAEAVPMKAPAKK